MNGSLKRHGVGALKQKRLARFFSISTVQLFVALTTFLCRAQLPPAAAFSAQSISGQFAVIAAQQVSPLANAPAVATNSEFVRLEPALLAVSAERIKQSLWQQLGMDDTARWRGQIFLALHPAQSLDENVTVISSRFNGVWIYRVELPDVLTQTRLTRALTGVVLLEIANRTAGEHSAEIPSWLVDGLSAQLLAENSAGFILSAPTKSDNGILENSFVASERGSYLLTGAHLALQNQPALTSEQLSWPTDAQLSGNDGGVYRASAQLFVHELLGLKNGADDLRATLQLLPKFLNWQIAFREAFKFDFPQPVDMEKWWALKTISFAAQDAGPMWTAEVSCEKLDEILSVPVEYYFASNSLPSHAEISLQTVIRNFDANRQMEILQTKARDLQVAELQMSPQFASLTESYRDALTAYLGERNSPPAKLILEKHFGSTPRKITAGDTLKKLDAIDAQRREIESSLDRPNSGQMPALTERHSNL